MKQKEYFVYIATNKYNRVLYTGITNNLIRRLYEHKNKLVSSFTSKYNVTKLIYWEAFDSPLDAIAREKQIKAGSRVRKLELIKSINPDFEDLYEKLVQ
ncbi:excinuclease ABC subunit C [Candidatus Curtissbacteria bacterium RIFCSPLOWO2_02_FULL_40_13b]|uniref:Excinuclease ABC subunit C n=2 Tax=Candidatus Curtissiibacteriota TaxID=1752717 RepID=A0A1F5HY91_9BACT|nr:MAG: excinuclease ABC subunit C [Candidatus Curtissbacteria bacterium RIFCSPHIGHO2_12_FULL_41_17]OGE08945.1 MAG: excinuclease ABC subunit C [Candidatus Curtissbacteria bacterium RIFCSPLOWO2_02_FULL_40_13b]